MATAKVYNQKGEEIESIELNPGLFAIEPETGLLEHVVRIQLANRRGSIASTKDRSEVRGGGRKPWRQKGTGRARHGSRRSPIWSGGGVTFGPSAERNWSLKVNKQVKDKALAMALTDKLQQGQLIILDTLSLDEPKTANVVRILTDLSTKIGKDFDNILVVKSGQEKDLDRAMRNLADIQLIRADSLNVFDVLKASALIVFKPSLEVMNTTYLKSI